MCRVQGTRCTFIPLCAKRVSPSAQEPAVPTLDSEMGASREGATGVPGERTWLAGVGEPGAPASGLGSLACATAPAPPLFPALHPAPFLRRYATGILNLRWQLNPDLRNNRRQAPHLSPRFDGLHLPRLSRHAAPAPHDDAHRHPHRGHLRLRQHDQQAAQGLRPAASGRRLRPARPRLPRRARPRDEAAAQLEREDAAPSTRWTTPATRPTAPRRPPTSSSSSPTSAARSRPSASPSSATRASRPTTSSARSPRVSPRSATASSSSAPTRT